MSRLMNVPKTGKHIKLMTEVSETRAYEQNH